MEAKWRTEACKPGSEGTWGLKDGIQKAMSAFSSKA